MRSIRFLRGAAIALCLTVTSVWAQSDEEAEGADPAAPPPLPPIDAAPAEPEGDVPIPPKVQDENAMVEPTVEIRRDEDNNLVEEYRLDGRVYMVKVTPADDRLPPYYYIDDDGDGNLELREGDRAAHPVKPVHWKLKEW